MCTVMCATVVTCLPGKAHRTDNALLRVNMDLRMWAGEHLRSSAAWL